MINCPNCGKVHNETLNPAFCEGCGASLKLEVEKATPPSNTGAKVMSFIGMGLGIFGLLLAFFELFIMVCCLYISYMCSTDIDLLYEFGSVATGYNAFNIGYSIFGLLVAAAALVLGTVACSKGVKTAPAKSARIMGVIGVVASVIAIIGCIISLAMIG